MRRSLLAVAVAMSFAAAPALADDKAINGIYQDMSAAYAALDVPAMEKIYTADASYLQPGPEGTVWQVGRESIVGGFRQFFDGARERGDKLDIDFRVVSRTHQGDAAAVDLGHFKLTVTPKGAEPQTMSGTFMTMPVRQPDGTWAFAADAYGPVKLTVYESAARVEGLQFD